MEEGDYQVFINHRGPDTKKTLAALFYQHLTVEGVRVFLDQNEIQTGERNTDAIKGAIKTSYVYIAIFSPKYAESSWCLDELCWMLERPESRFIPIFHGVKPWELRRIEKGTYANAFTHHHPVKHKVDNEVLENWKNVLLKAADIHGEEFHPGDRESMDIVQLVNNVVNMVLEEVWRKKPLEVAEHPVGLKQAADEFQNKIFQYKISDQYKENDIITVGIVGAGGSGKSTLVKYLYNMNRIEFKRSYLLSVTSEEECPCSQPRRRSCGRLRNEYPSLQYRLLNRHHLPIEDPSNGKSLLQRLEEHLEGSPKVLIILDELYNSKQIRNLLSLKCKLGHESMVVVTSRDRDLLKRSKIDISYDIKPLDDGNARNLFCQHAFGLPRPLGGFDNFVQDVLGICEGLPLALKLLGEHFCEVTDRSLWAEKRRRLDNELPHGTEKILNASYMSLADREKEVFLDVAHFLVGEDKELVERVLEGLDSSGLACLRSLQQKCLVEYENVAVNFYDETKHGKRSQSEAFCTDQWRRSKRCLKIKMNRLLRDLAREKAREELRSLPLHTPLRLSWAESADNSLQPGSFSNVRGIRISKWSKKPVTEHVRELKFLVLEDSGLPFQALSGDLVWLRLHNSIHNQVLSRPSLGNLRVMELKGVPLENLSIAPDDEPPLELRELIVDLQQISHESASSPSSTASIPPLSSRFDENPTGSFLLCGCRLLFGELKNLVKLVWKNVKGLEFFPVKFEALRELRHLDLSGWSDLKEMPASFTSLSHLQYLALQDCSNLATVDLGGVSTIECLDFEGCGKLQRLPEGVTNQSSLRYLNLLRTEVQYLPQGLGKLGNLEHLFIGSPYLKYLPGSLNKLVHLTELTLIGCSSLCSISKSIEQLKRLEILRIRHSGVNILSEGIPWTKIKVLDVVNCPIETLEIGSHPGGMIDQNDVSSLKRLSIRGTNISKISIPDKLCPNIEIIDLSENVRLKVVEGVSGKLIRLNLIDCPTLNTVTCLSNLEKFPNISGCGELKFLNVQDAAGCWKLQSIQEFSQLQA